MKKIINSALMVTVATILFSCQKQRDLDLSKSPMTESQSSTGKPGLNIPLTVSEWISVPLEQSRHGGLYGRHELKQPLPFAMSEEVKLVYVRHFNQGIPTSSDGLMYNPLPSVLNSLGGYLTLVDFTLGTNFLEIFITPLDISNQLLIPSEFKNCSYRYIVINSDDYEHLEIDWTNYLEVAAVLNFTP